jgi:hypothetical protein
VLELLRELEERELFGPRERERERKKVLVGDRLL